MSASKQVTLITTILNLYRYTWNKIDKKCLFLCNGVVVKYYFLVAGSIHFPFLTVDVT